MHLAAWVALAAHLPKQQRQRLGLEVQLLQPLQLHLVVVQQQPQQHREDLEIRLLQDLVVLALVLQL